MVNHVTNTVLTLDDHLSLKEHHTDMEVIPVFAGTLVIILYLCELSSGASCFGPLAPICGQDGVTYANECYAKKA